MKEWCWCAATLHVRNAFMLQGNLNCIIRMNLPLPIYSANMEDLSIP